ncbi:MAG: hypothetical protein QXX12_02820 [Nanopusillaceae archaeon]
MLSQLEYAFGPRRVSSVSGRVVVSLPKHLYHLKGRRVIVKLIVLPEEELKN